MTTVFQRVGPYEILREIGRGGMAAVFLADDSRHARQVALKLVPVGHDREAREILDAERWGARLQGQLARACGLVPRVYEEGANDLVIFTYGNGVPMSLRAARAIGRKHGWKVRVVDLRWLVPLNETPSGRSEARYRYPQSIRRSSPRLANTG